MAALQLDLVLHGILAGCGMLWRQQAAKQAQLTKQAKT